VTPTSTTLYTPIQTTNTTRLQSILVVPHKNIQASGPLSPQNVPPAAINDIFSASSTTEDVNESDTSHPISLPNVTNLARVKQPRASDSESDYRQLQQHVPQSQSFRNMSHKPPFSCLHQYSSSQGHQDDTLTKLRNTQPHVSTTGTTHLYLHGEPSTCSPFSIPN